MLVLEYLESGIQCDLCVGDTGQSNYGTAKGYSSSTTDASTDDGFVLVQGKKPRTKDTDRTWAEVVANMRSVPKTPNKQICFKSILLKQSNKYRD